MGDLEPRLFRAVAEFREALMEIGMTVEHVENHWQTEHGLMKGNYIFDSPISSG